MNKSEARTDFYPDVQTLDAMVAILDPCLLQEGYYDEVGFETSPGLHAKKLKDTQRLATALYRAAISGLKKSQPEG